MTTRTSNNSGGRLAEAIESGGRVFQRLVDSREAISEAMEDRRRTMNRALKRGREAAEDLVYQTGRSIKHSPFRSVAIAFGAGTLLGLAMFRNGKR